MKQNVINKIHTMGKIGSIITLILKIIMIIGLALFLLVTIIFGVMPKDLFTLNLGTNVEVTIPYALSGAFSYITVEAGDDSYELSLGDSESAAGNDSADIDTSVDINGTDFTIEEIDTDNDSFHAVLTTNTPAAITKGDVTRLMVVADIAVLLTIISLTLFRKLCRAFQTCNSPFDALVIRKMQQFACSLIPWIVFSIISNRICSNMLSGSLVDSTGSINLGALAIVIILFALTYIFKYGAMLQQESDETL